MYLYEHNCNIHMNTVENITCTYVCMDAYTGTVCMLCRKDSVECGIQPATWFPLLIYAILQSALPFQLFQSSNTYFHLARHGFLRVRK